MPSIIPSYLVLALSILSQKASATPLLPNTNPLSARLADSVIARGQAIADNNPAPSTYLKVGFFQTAVLRLIDSYCVEGKDERCDVWEEYLVSSTDSIVPHLGNATGDTELPLDRFSVARGLLHQYEKTNKPVYKSTLDAMHKSITLQPQNPLGGYWYFHYPNWSYLDGMYSLIPFLTLYDTHFPTPFNSSTDSPKNLIHQMDLLWTHCRQNHTGLLAHGYDSSRTAVWADPVTGSSPIIWGRALGWYVMALVDTLELVSSSSFSSEDEKGGKAKLASYLKSHLQTLSASVVKAADSDSGCWWQVMTAPNQEGNYIESSGSSMFTYALFKGVRLGYLPKEYVDVAGKCLSYMRGEFVFGEGGEVGFNGTVAVCSLNSVADYQYYVGQPVEEDSVHGAAAFVLASLEGERRA